jgi:hypothetical protein
MNAPVERKLVTGVSPYFAMAQMDDESHPEADVYVEDDESRILVKEIIGAEKPQLVRRCCLIPFGAASVGQALGTMVNSKRFPRPSVVFLDGEQPPTIGCNLLPGGDVPERVVFEALKIRQWPDIHSRITRPPADVIDALESAMTQGNHHDWIRAAANRLYIGASDLWRALASAWASECLSPSQRRAVTDVIEDSINGLAGVSDSAKTIAQKLTEARAVVSAKIEAAAAAIEPILIPDTSPTQIKPKGRKKSNKPVGGRSLFNHEE